MEEEDDGMDKEIWLVIRPGEGSGDAVEDEVDDEDNDGGVVNVNVFDDRLDDVNDVDLVDGLGEDVTTAAGIVDVDIVVVDVEVDDGVDVDDDNVIEDWVRYLIS